MYGCISTDVLPPVETVQQTFYTGLRKERTTTLNRAVPSVLRPLKRVTESVFEVSEKSKEI